MLEIVQQKDPVLRKKAKPVPLTMIGTPELTKVLTDMRRAMASQKDGVAIAAPQIGASLQIFMVSGEVLSKADKEYTGDTNDLVFINPVITKLSKDKKLVEEGCLSVRWLYGTIKRSTRASISAINEKGEKVERGASGLLAQIFQHETDHLKGTLFIDNAESVWEMTEEEIAQAQGK
ncbi:MAG TPA: peptide deformylase [Candidatus Paceibacterota bacterium]|jgi:peptide deformylase|nr:peptide deformylase [Candidatus Paceibacterota bacterium]